MNDAALAPRITLGRVLRLDRRTRKKPSPVWLRLPVHGCYALLLILLMAAVACNPAKPADVPLIICLLAGHWLLLGGLIELVIWTLTYELQLLPFGIKQTAWGRTTELIEPEIVGGRWLWWTQRITLRAGDTQATIRLLNFRHFSDRAAIIEHCSQFLSPQQQADFGREWTQAFYELITHRKPNLLRTMLVFGAFYVAGSAFVIAFNECILWCYPDAVLRHGGSLRTSYLGLLFIPVMLIWIPLGFYGLERRFGTRPKEVVSG